MEFGGSASADQCYRFDRLSVDDPALNMVPRRLANV